MIESDQAEHLKSVLLARGQLLRFTPERPLIISPTLHWHLQQYPELADLMDRVKVNGPLPTNPPETGQV